MDVVACCVSGMNTDVERDSRSSDCVFVVNDPLVSKCHCYQS